MHEYDIIVPAESLIFNRRNDSYFSFCEGMSDCHSCFPSFLPTCGRNVLIPFENSARVSSVAKDIIACLQCEPNVSQQIETIIRLCSLAEGKVGESADWRNPDALFDEQCTHLALVHLLLRVLLSIPLLSESLRVAKEAADALGHNAFVAVLSYCTWVGNSDLVSPSLALNIQDSDCKSRFGRGVLRLQELIILAMYAAPRTLGPEGLEGEDFRWLLPCLAVTHGWEAHKLGGTLTGAAGSSAAVRLSADCLHYLRHRTYQVALAQTTLCGDSAAVVEGLRRSHIYIEAAVRDFFLVHTSAAGAGGESTVGGNAQASGLYAHLCVLVEFLVLCPPEVVRCHLLALVGVLSAAIGIAFVPLQLLAADICGFLAGSDAGLGPYLVRLSVELMRAYLYYSRGCSDVGALADWQGKDSARHATERDQLLRRIRVLCTSTLPDALLRQESTAEQPDGSYHQYTVFFSRLREASAEHSSILLEWHLTAGLTEDCAAP